MSNETLTGDNRIANCDLRASLSGYTSDSINLATRSALDSPDVGTILLHRMGAADAAMTVTATTLKAPKEARKALQKGLDLTKKNRPGEAIASLQDAVRTYPEFQRSPGANSASCNWRTDTLPMPTSRLRPR